MRSIIINIILLFLVAGGPGAGAQETLLPLTSNPMKEHSQPFLAGKSEHLPLLLPFWDDFSNEGPFPDPALWADQHVFVNRSFGIHPKTIGVATFDALDQAGNLYEHITASNTPYVADILSSHPIRLDSVFSPLARSLSPADSVILSFYYQPQGRGGNPAWQDSLVLEFLHTPGYYTLTDELEVIWVEDAWQSVWHATGESLSEFSRDTFPYFKRVSIAITDPVYFRDDFSFRFKSHVSFPLPGNPSLQNNTGNRSIWNIDYVYLNSGRSSTRTDYFDIAFASQPQSILARYTAMPWSHYIADPARHLRSNFSMAITNLDQNIFPYSYRYYIQDETGNIIRNYSGGTWNIAPFSTHGYQEYQPHANPIVIPNPLPNAPADGRYFDIVHVIRAGIAGDNHQRNDTVSRRQSFGNYFAYDDGIPEAGYGVIGRFPKTAKRFVSGKPDQIKSVDIFFNQTIDESNGDRPLKITIWKRLAPVEEILYQSEDPIRLNLTDNYNRFVSFELEQAVEVTDTFYVGIEQQGNVGIDGFLSIGFDFNNDAGSEIFFNTGNEWLRSIYKGALMIRPVFRSVKSDEVLNLPEKRQMTATVYPNPATGGQIRIQLDQSGDGPTPLGMDVIDIYGKLIYSGDYCPYLGIEGMANGMYFLRIIPNAGKAPSVTPFIIAR